MSRLLNKTVVPFAVFSLLILLISIPAYFFIINDIWQEELDEHHYITAQKIERELNLLSNPAAVAEAVEHFNYLGAGGQLVPLEKNAVKADTVYSQYRFDAFYQEEERFRVMSCTLNVHGHLYRFTVETNIEESDETVMAIALVTLCFLLLLLVGFFFLNRRLSKSIWQPFYKTLDALKSFDLSSEAAIGLDKSDILEFGELNTAINKLISRNILVYQQQKEFTENASHELQTPLAIIKSKIDVLLQDTTLTQQQAEKIAALNKSLARASRINKNLVLLSKIENEQPEAEQETFSVQHLAEESLNFLNEQLAARSIVLTKAYTGECIITASKNLVEIAVLNLLLNAVRHNIDGGKMHIAVSVNTITISNSGTGALRTEALFKRFSSASRTITGGGSGLGLAIVKQICSRYKWHVDYEFRDGLHFFSIRF